jgi:hypothetical protein
MAALTFLVGPWDEWIRWHGAVLWFGAFTEWSDRVWN